MKKIIALTIMVMLLLTLLPHGQVIAAEDDGGALQQLQDSVEYWRQRGRTDKMVEIWIKILRSNPNHAPTLAELAMFYARSGNKAKANQYLQRLQAAHPGHPAIASIQAAIDTGTGYKSAVEEARALVKQGRKKEAVAKYREAFGGSPPSGALALEFYQTLGGASGGWAEAKQGLERLTNENPGNNRIALAYAKHLTYTEGTRRQGIARLQSLSGTSVGSQARSAWKQALLWLGASLSDAALFKAYLAQVGPDAEIQKRLDTLSSTARAAQPMPDRLDEGYKALEDQNLETADAAFRWAVSQRGDNIDAIVGLALVEMQKENFTKARKLLEEVEQMAPDQPEKWQTSLQSARFWETLRAGDKDVENHRFVEGEAKYRQAMQISPEEATHAQLALANLYVEKEDYESAGIAFQQLLQTDPNNVGALQAMIQMQLVRGQTEAAMVLNDRLAAIDPGKAWKPKRLQAETLRSRANLQRKVGETYQALTLLTEARKLDPTNTWVLFDLAIVQAERGEIEQARLTMNQLLTVEPDNIDIRLASARLYAEENNFNKALATLAEIPREKQNDKVRELQRMLEVQGACFAAVRKATISGQAQVARTRLAELQSQNQDDPKLIAAIALAWADIGDYERALGLARSAVARSQSDDSGVRLQYAAVLLKAERYPDLEVQLDNLLEDPNLNGREKKDLANLRIAYAVRRADRAREAGNTATGFAHLTPLLKEYKDDPRLVNAVGRLFYSTNDFSEAETVFNRVLANHPDDLEARQGAILSAINLDKNKQARFLIEEGLRKFPSDPRMLLIAARAERLRGHDARALNYLKQALGYEEAKQGSGSPSTLDPNGDDTEGKGQDVYELVMAKAQNQVLDPYGNTEAQEVDTSLHTEIKREIAAIEKHYSTTLGVAPRARYRDGEPGMSRLTEIRGDFRLQIPAGFRGLLDFNLAPVYLTAGEVDLKDPGVAERFGSYGAYAAEPIDNPESFDATGLEVSMGYRFRGFRIHVGSSPIGFPLETVVGGLEIGDEIKGFGFRLSGERSLVKDSFLSYAGVEDPLDGTVWGAVTRNGGKLDLSFRKKPVLVYFFGGYYYMLGTEVQENQNWTGGSGLQWTVQDTDDIRLITGLQGTALGYTENLSRFNRGHGGYFSPEFFINTGVPLLFDGRIDYFTYRIDGLVGVNWFQEAETDYFPGELNLQNLRETVVKASGDPVDPTYDKRESSLSFALNAGASIGYFITPKFQAGLKFHIYTAEEYTEFIGGFGLEYTFGMPSGDRKPELGRLPMQ